MSLENPKYKKSRSTLDRESLFSFIRGKRTKRPWKEWNLDKDFLNSLSEYNNKHPDTFLDSILDRIYTCIKTSQDFVYMIPDSPFPAQSLVMALGSLLKLGITVKRARQDTYEFAKQVVEWVNAVKTAFENMLTQNNDFNTITWRNLKKTRELIDEICLWAHSRFEDGRWKRIKNGFRIGQEIDAFKERLHNSKEMFNVLSLVNLQGGMSSLRDGVNSFKDLLNKNVNEFNRFKKSQLDYLTQEMEESKKSKDRKLFLEKNLDIHTVRMSGYEMQGKDPCDEETRKAELVDIMQWLNSTSLGSQNFLWLTGEPGCGKSAITASLAAHCKDEGILWAQYFVNHNVVQTTDPKSFFPTIAHQLADFSPVVEGAIYDKLKDRPTLADRMTPDQATQLFYEALALAASLDPRKVVAVIIDGLDEIEKEHLHDTATILSNLFTLSHSPNVKVFISSRTEDDIRRPFYPQIQVSKVKHVHLDTASSVEDVTSFMKKQLEKVAIHNGKDKDVWPTEEQIQKLATRASGLFIWAVTAVKYISERLDEDGFECLEIVVDELDSEALMEINELYTLVLQSSKKKHYKWVDWSYEKFRRIVGAIVILKQPLSLYDLSGLLDLRGGSYDTPADVVNFVRRHRTFLVSGIETVDEKTTPRLHNSFVEFITNKELFTKKSLSLDARFFVDPRVAEAELSASCFKRISGSFKEVETAAPRGGLEYALQFCYSHASAVEKTTTTSVAFVLPDPKTKVEDVRTLVRSIATQQCGSLTPWFPLDYERPPPSPFTPLTFAYQPALEGEPAYRILTDIIEYTSCLVYSPDGDKLVTGLLEDGLLILYDVRTGAEIANLKGHTSLVQSVTFSPSGDRIASVSADKTARLWDASTGQLVNIIDLLDDEVYTVTYSPDGNILATGSLHGTVSLWDACSGKLINGPLEHDDDVQSVFFTLDGNLIISNTYSTLYVWDRNTFECRKKIKSPVFEVHKMMISPNGARMIAVGNKGTCFWNKITDDFALDENLTSKFGYDATDAAFCADSKSIFIEGLATAEGREHGLFIYDLASRVMMSVLNPDRMVYDFALSPNGSSVAYGNGKQIHIARIPQRHPVALMALSPDGDMAVCSFFEGTVWLASPKRLPFMSKQLDGKVGQIVYLAFTSNNAFVAGVDEEFLYVWEVSTQVLRWTASCKNFPPVTDLFFLDDQRTPVTSHSDKCMTVWDVCDTVDGILIPRTSSSNVRCDLKLLLEFDDDRVSECASSRFYLGTRNGRNSGIWAYIDDCLMRVRADGSVTMLPLVSNLVPEFARVLKFKDFLQ